MSGMIVAFDLYAPKDAWPALDYRRASLLEDLLGTSDVITLHVSLIKSTRDIIR